jgi:hypothetical protein
VVAVAVAVASVASVGAVVVALGAASSVGAVALRVSICRVPDRRSIDKR